jgi:hypothetical protein
MIHAFIDREMGTTIHLALRAAVWLLDSSRSPFPNLIQPLPWAVLELSVSLPTPFPHRVSLLTPPLNGGFR